MRYVTDHPELGQSPEDGFDCSGFVKFVLIQAGLFIPDYIGMDSRQRPIRHANEFWDHYGVTVQEHPLGGDLIFFSRKGILPTHIGIVRDQNTYIHAPGRDGSKVCVDEITDETIISRETYERMLYVRNPIGFKSPATQIERPTYRYHQKPL